MLFLLIKLFTTPALIWASTLAARRWGPVIGGGLAGLPFISGPASLFIAVQYGTPFAASAAASSLLGAVASCCYCLAYAHSARRFGWAAPSHSPCSPFSSAPSCSRGFPADCP